jgi:hypothetical protein
VALRIERKAIAMVGADGFAGIEFWKLEQGLIEGGCRRRGRRGGWSWGRARYGSRRGVRRLVVGARSCFSRRLVARERSWCRLGGRRPRGPG